MRFGTIVLATLVALSIPNPGNAGSHGGGRGGSAPERPSLTIHPNPRISVKRPSHTLINRMLQGRTSSFSRSITSRVTVRLPFAIELESHDQFETR